jgi:hypothetical protein
MADSGEEIKFEELSPCQPFERQVCWVWLIAFIYPDNCDLSARCPEYRADG